MIDPGHLFALSIVAVIVDRHVLDRCLGRGYAFRNEHPFKRSLVLGACVTGILLLSSFFTGVAMDLVLTPLDAVYLLPLTYIIAIVATALCAELLFSLLRPFAQLHRLFARASVLAAFLVLPVLAPLFGAYEQEYLLYWRSVVLGGISGLAFTLALVLHTGITRMPVFTDGRRDDSLARELLIGALLLLAFEALSPLPLFAW